MFKDYVRKLSPSLKFNDTQPCVICGVKCLARPQKSLSSDVAWVEGLSPSCIHWSSQGQRSQWLGEHNIALVCWAAGCAIHCPDLIFLECTPQLDLGFLTDLSWGRLQWYSVVLALPAAGLPVEGNEFGQQLLEPEENLLTLLIHSQMHSWLHVSTGRWLPPQRCMSGAPKVVWICTLIT